MGFGILAIACLLFLSPIGGSLYVSSFSLSLWSLLFLFLFMGFYQIYARIRSKWNLLGLWLCVIFVLLVLILPETNATWMVNMLGPWLFFIALQGSKAVCVRKTQQQIHIFTIYFIIWYVLLLMMSRLDVEVIFSKVSMFLLISLQLITTLWLFYLCLHINRELKDLDIIRPKERAVPMTKRNAILAVLLLPCGLFLLYALQLPYMKTLLRQEIKKPETVLFYETTQEGSILGSGYRYDLDVFSQPQVEISYQDMMFSTPDQSLIEQTYKMKQRFLVDGAEIEHGGVKESTHIQKGIQNNNREFTIRFDEIEEDRYVLDTGNASHTMELTLYDKQEQVLYEHAFSLHQQPIITLAGSQDGIRVSSLSYSAGNMLATPELEFSFLKTMTMPKYDEISYQLQINQGEQETLKSPIWNQKVVQKEPLIPSETRLWMLEDTWSTILLDAWQDRELTSAELELTFLKQGKVVYSETIPLEVIP